MIDIRVGDYVKRKPENIDHWWKRTISYRDVNSSFEVSSVSEKGYWITLKGIADILCGESFHIIPAPVELPPLNQ